MHATTTRSPFAAFVHEYETAAGATRYAVAEWVESAAQYQWPLPEATRKASGCSGGFARKASGSDWRYGTRASAMRAARRLYGERVAFEAMERAWDRAAAASERVRLF